MKKIIIFSAIIFLFVSFGIDKSNAQDTNRVLFEGVTGTWCQYCPCGHTILDAILASFPNTLALEYHGPNSPSYNDPWKIFNGNDIIPLMGFSSYPTGVIGRRSGIISRSAWYSVLSGQVVLYTPTPISLSFTQSYNTGTRQLTVNVSSTAYRNIDTNTNITFVLTESGLIYPQTGNSSCPGGSNYIHNYVVRNIVNGSTGELFSSGTWAQGVTKTKTFVTTLDAGWAAEKVEIGVFVYFPSGSLSTNSYVLQTAKAMVNTAVGLTNNSENVNDYYLAQNYPNPFNPNTNIKFTIPKEAFTSFKVYNSLGKEVQTYWNDILKAGIYNVQFDASSLPGGVYFYKLTSGSFTDTKKMILIK